MSKGGHLSTQADDVGRLGSMTESLKREQAERRRHQAEKKAQSQEQQRLKERKKWERRQSKSIEGRMVTKADDVRWI